MFNTNDDKVEKKFHKVENNYRINILLLETEKGRNNENQCVTEKLIPTSSDLKFTNMIKITRLRPQKN